ncbi:MAG: ferritin-like domain-containing protein [Solirubrobacterales bacterium]|nr:ferritin-like domain-containing protein [Solirubrobacterales bacterium]
MHTLSLADIDVDGALRETAGRLPTRSEFLVGGGLAAAAALLVPGVAGARAKRSDDAILNFALALEYLQAAFYTEAERVGALSGPLAEQAKVVGAHERAHVAAFREVLGRAAIKRPQFDFHGVTDKPDSFRATAVAFEDLAVGAYKEQLPKISSPQYLAAAVSIHSVEARHASWIRRLAGIVPAPTAFDEPTSDGQTIHIVNSTQFVTLHAPETTAHRPPAFTG